MTKWHGDKARWVLDAWTEVWLDRRFASWNLDAQLGRVQCPVLIIHGDADEFGSLAFPERIAAQLRGPVGKVIFSSCGHIPHRAEPQAVLCLMDAFIRTWVQ